MSAFLHYADIYLLQESPGPVHRSRSFWIYLTAQLLVSLLAAFLLYRKAGLPTTDWPLATALASLGAFSVIQSFTLKFGDKGIDARQLFDAWKSRVLADVRRVATSARARDQGRVSRELAARFRGKEDQLEAALGHLARASGLDPESEVVRAKAVPALGIGHNLAAAITGIDLEYAKGLRSEGPQS